MRISVTRKVRVQSYGMQILYEKAGARPTCSSNQEMFAAVVDNQVKSLAWGSVSLQAARTSMSRQLAEIKRIFERSRDPFRHGRPGDSMPTD